MFSRDGHWFAFLEKGQPLRVWDLQARREVLALTELLPNVSALALSADGQRLVVGNIHGQLRVIAARTGKTVANLAGHVFAIRGLAFTADGRRLVSASADGWVKLWDPAAGAEVLSLRAQAWPDNALAVSPHGDLIAGAGADGALKVWSCQDPARPVPSEIALQRKRDWHMREAEQSIQARQGFAARHHHRQLAELRPGQR